MREREIKHAVGQTRHQSAAFDGRQEPVRPHQLTVAAPADERLDSDDTSTVRLDLGLIDELDRAVLQRLANRAQGLPTPRNPVGGQ